MTTPVDICNRALSEAATQSTIASLDESSPEAVQCSLWYDKLRRQLLRSAPWAFARRQLALTLLGNAVDETGVYPFLFMYAYPSDCLKFRYILAPPAPSSNPVAPQVGVGLPGIVSWAPSRQNRFLVHEHIDSEGVQTKVILSNVEGAYGVYTMNLSNPDKFDDLFEGALTSALAYKLSLALTGNLQVNQLCKDQANNAIKEARAADANESITTTDHSVDWIATRGGGSALYGFGCGAAQPWGDWYSGYDNLNWSM